MSDRYHVEEQMSVEEIAGKLKVDASTVWRWAKAGKLGRPRKLGRRIVRYPASAVNKFLESRAV